MRARRWLPIVLLFSGLCACSSGTQPSPPPEILAVEATRQDRASSLTPHPGVISGVVRDEHQPVAGAVVRIQTTDHHDVSDEQGRFTIELPDPSDVDLNLTGWATGYFCSGPFTVSAGDTGVEIELVRHPSGDNADYQWLPSRYHPGQGEDQGCAECHSRDGTDLAFSLPVDEWLLDAHSQSVSNPRFLTMYAGTDLHGNQSPLTRIAFSRDYGSFPLAPDLTKPYYGPGYKLDFNDSAGNCAACHAPAAAANSPYDTDPTTILGVEAEGLPCDFCHKIWDVRLDPQTQLPYPNYPGVLSIEFRRPEAGHQFFAGPFDDVAPGEDTFSPLQNESAFCAPCHFGVFWDTTIYNSYGEWLASPYSDPDDGRTCQDCHMPPSGATQFATSEAGGRTRDPEKIFSHRMPGALDEGLLQDALDMQIETVLEEGTLRVTVRLSNDNTGHNIPTDSPLRHMILILNATDEQGNPLSQIDGPTLPDWAGVGSPSEGYYAGQPGKAYALILQELWTEVAPSGAYWNPTRVVADTRLSPFQEDRSSFDFRAEAGGEMKVQVRLLLRRAFIDLMDQKGWADPDVVMLERTTTVKP